MLEAPRLVTGFYARFQQAAERFGERTAIEVQGRDGLDTWSYARLRARAEHFASLLSARGVGRGDRCALLAEDGALWCAAFLGMMRLGAVPVPLDTTYTPAQVSRLVSDSGARVIAVSPRFREKVEGGACSSFVLDDESAPVGGTRADIPGVTLEPEETAVMVYTSGTTSDPKGVVLTHGNLAAEIDSAMSVISINEDDAILSVLPLFHVLAQLANLLIPLSLGARVVFMETVSSGELMRAFHDRDISAFCCVPQFYHLIHERVLEQVARGGRLGRAAFGFLLGTTGFLRERLGINLGPLVFKRVHRALGPRMRLLVTGGSRLDPRVGRDLYRLGFNILQAYGLTESTGAATVLRPDDPHVDSVGQALPDVELRIVPTGSAGDGEGAPATDAEAIGEVAIRGPVVSPGYFQRPDASAVTFRDGWLHTGDLGYLDSAGRLFITGRAKEMIVLGSGKNIYPEEIEAHYAQSPYIKELCVVGRSLPGAPASERLHAVVVPDFEVLRERKVFNSRDMLRFEIETLSSQLPGHKRILSYDVVTEDLPRTTTRKLKRFEIERRLDAAGLADTEPDRPEDEEERAWSTDPEVARVLEVIKSATHAPDAVRRSANLELDLGLDSMGRVELLAALEARFGVSLPEGVVHGIHTVGELVDAVRAAGTAEPGETGADFDPWSNLLDDVSDDDPAVAPILVSRPLLTAVGFVACKLLYVAAWLLLGLRVSGREHLPREGPFLISPNHQSFLDVFLLVSALPFRVFRNMFYVGASEYFETPFWAWIARLIHVVPVDPDANLVRAMRAGAHGLRNGKVLILFPEGERSIDATIKTFKKGAAILSLKVGAPIVPVALDGMFDIWPRARQPRFSKLLPLSGARARIRFGPPLEPVEEVTRAEDAYVAVTARLRDTIGAMLRELSARAARSEV
jgi:long-chain acyl-CoA synthetase